MDFQSPKTLTFNVDELNQSDDSNDDTIKYSYEQTPDHYYLGGKLRDDLPEVKRAKKRLNLEDGTENYSSKRTRESNKKSVVKLPPPRCEGSLTKLTKKFVDILLAKGGRSVNLNSVSDELSVPKRRLYDITNVLEGAGLLNKPSRNLVQWKPDDNACPTNLQAEVDDLEMKENLLDDAIKIAETSLASVQEQNKEYAYVTYEDFKAINSFRNDTLIGIKAGPDAKLCVPELFKLFINSKSCPILAYLIDDDGFTPLSSNINVRNIIKISNNKIYLQDDFQLKNALISEDDDFLGNNFLLQTEDQLLDLPSFEINEVDYNFMLDNEEGLPDLFDPYDLSSF